MKPPIKEVFHPNKPCGDGLFKSAFKIEGLPQLDDFAHQLSSRLLPGDVLTLTGEMGAGKTTFTQHLGSHLGITEKITSPTFVLIHDYLSGRLPLVHADLYRLETEGAESVAQDLISTIEEGQSLVVVEWAGFGSFLAPYTTLHLHFTQPNLDNADLRTVELVTPNPERFSLLGEANQ